MDEVEGVAAPEPLGFDVVDFEADVERDPFGHGGGKVDADYLGGGVKVAGFDGPVAFWKLKLARLIMMSTVDLNAYHFLFRDRGCVLGWMELGRGGGGCRGEGARLGGRGRGVLARFRRWGGGSGRRGSCGRCGRSRTELRISMVLLKRILLGLHRHRSCCTEVVMTRGPISWSYCCIDDR